MTTGVKLRKIDQLIEKFFYDGLRATNSTPVKVISSSISKYSSSNNERKRRRKPSTTKSSTTVEAEEDETLEDKKIKENNNNIKSQGIIAEADKKDKDISMNVEDDDKEEGDEGQKPSTSKEVITTNLIKNSKCNGSIDQRSDISGGTLGGTDQHQQQQPSYVSAAAYAAAAGFGAFLNPHHHHQHSQSQDQQQHLTRTTMDTYPLTAHMQATENPPSNGYVNAQYDAYPYYQKGFEMQHKKKMPSKTRSSSVSSDFINVVDIEEEEDGLGGQGESELSSEIVMEYDCYWPSSTGFNNSNSQSKHYQPVQSPGDFQGNYILQTQQNSPMSIDGEEANSLSHTARTSPATLIWLSENYEPCEGSSLPRCTLYTHYKRHCLECALDPVNPASFGKLIRSVFRGLKTRRLGTRGNSKYHYYGIRIKPNSPYINEVENDRHMIKHGRRSDVQHHNQSASSTNGYATRAATAAAASNNIHNGTNSSNGSQSSASPSSTIAAPVPTSGSSLNGHSTTFTPTTPNEPNGGFVMEQQSQQLQPHQQQPKSPHHEVSESFAAMMGQINIPSIEIPNFEESEAFLIPMDLEIGHADKFMVDYLAASTEMLHLIEQQRFKSVENLWLNFWSGNRSGSLTQEQMFNLVTLPDVFKTIDKMDQLFYQAAVDLLMPNVFAPLSNMKYLTAIRNFVKQIVPTFRKALEKAPLEFLNLKVSSGKAFAHRMKRYTAIHHLSDAARAVLSHPKQVETMYNEFCQIDVASIQEQAGWVCECDPILFNSIFNAFKENLKAARELEAWAEWMEAIVDQVLAKYHDQPLHVQVAKSKQLIHDWNYYSSAIIRDLTLRSANSFGSFHLLKILFEDYIFYLVELRLAKTANTPVVCLLTKNWIGNTNLTHMDYIDPSSAALQQAPVVTQMIMHDSSVTSSNIQYVVTDHQPKYVFSNSQGYLMTSANDDYVMVSTSEGHYVDHQLLGNGAQQLETIVYVDEHGQQTTAENSAAQYIVMTGLPTVTSTGEALDIENNNGGMGRRESSFEPAAKMIRTADEMVLSGDILEANDESDVKQS